MILIYLTVIILICPADALMGYDCNGPHPNGTLISLLEMEECTAPEGRIMLHEAQIELIQLPKYAKVSVLTCRVEFEKAIYDNGNSQPNHSIKTRRSYLQIELNECMHMHNYGKFKFHNTTFKNLKIDFTNSKLLPISNIVDPLSQIPEKNTNITIKHYLHISFKQFYIKVNTLKDKIILPSGTCRYTELHCIDEDGYYNFWSPIFHKGCHIAAHAVKYRGTSNKIESHKHPTAYSLPYEDNNLIIFISAQHNACNASLLQTEHPHLIIKELKTVKNHPKILSPLNQLCTIVDSISPHFFIANYIKSNVKAIYSELLLNKCANKRPELQAAMQTAHMDANQFAYTLTGGPGYSAHIRGEAAEIYQCTPVPVQQRITENCFLELPILVGNEPMYLTPKTRTISVTGTEIACGPETAVVFKLKNVWAQFQPRPDDIVTPLILDTTKHQWGRSIPVTSSGTVASDSTTAQQGSSRWRIIVFSLALIIGAIACLIIIWQCFKLKGSVAKVSKASPTSNIEAINLSQLHSSVQQYSRTCDCTLCSYESVKLRAQQTITRARQFSPSLYNELATASESLDQLDRRIDDCLKGRHSSQH
jgi:hypothetical protein